jgi:hypothetical protein
MGNGMLVAGVGKIPFRKPGASAPYDEMGWQGHSRGVA